jgi:hypothetical protein
MQTHDQCVTMLGEHARYTTERPHEPTVKLRIVLVFNLIDKVEVATHDPRSCVCYPDGSEFIQEKKLLLVTLRAIYDRNPPGRFSDPMF